MTDLDVVQLVRRFEQRPLHRQGDGTLLLVALLLAASMLLVLIATASVEMGVTFRAANLLFMEPGFEPLNFLQRYGRAARKGHYRTAPDFRHFVGIYHWVKAQTPDFGDYVVFRRYLKTLSGVYRWHFASFQHPSVRKSLHETIKIETHCEHCGSVAKVLIDRLIEANLWAV